MQQGSGGYRDDYSYSQNLGGPDAIEKARKWPLLSGFQGVASLPAAALPSEAAQKPVLREGSNGFTCIPGNPNVSGDVR